MIVSTDDVNILHENKMLSCGRALISIWWMELTLKVSTPTLKLVWKMNSEISNGKACTCERCIIHAFIEEFVINWNSENRACDADDLRMDLTKFVRVLGRVLHNELGCFLLVHLICYVLPWHRALNPTGPWWPAQKSIVGKFLNPTIWEFFYFMV